MEIKKKDRSSLCLACGFNFEEYFGFKPWSGDNSSLEICPSCGIQFGYDDAAGGNLKQRQEVYKIWRERWIKGGMRWWSKGHPKPDDWDPSEQLRHLDGR